MRAELWKCGFYESWALRMWILWELSIEKGSFMRAELCKCGFYEGWALWAEHCECEFVRAGHCKYEFNEHWVL